MTKQKQNTTQFVAAGVLDHKRFPQNNIPLSEQINFVNILDALIRKCCFAENV